jgi:hypothetical protein
VSVADAMFDSYMRRTGQRGPVDGVHQFQLSFLRDTLRRLEAAMQDEQIPEDTATRVLRALLYGAPGVAEAELRVQQQEAIVQLINERPQFFPGGSTP